MRQLTTQPEPTIHHFSHPHLLHLTNTIHHNHQTLACSACKLQASSGPTYTCQTCPYILHLTCSQLPQKIHHPFHQHHTFSLLPTPSYPEGLFSCDACGSHGNGFSYHCKPCGLDLHVVCASAPLSLSHRSHHHHLTLAFSPPYHNKSFSCDICGSAGADHWLYRCGSCDFDAHLSCANAKPPVGPVQAPLPQVQGGPIRPIQMQLQYQTPLRFQNQMVNQPVQMQTLQMPSRINKPGFQSTFGAPYAATAGPYAARPYMQNYPPNNIPMNLGNVQGGVAQNNAFMNQNSASMNQNNTIMDQAIQGFVSGVAEAAGQQLFQGLMGGGGGGLDGSAYGDTSTTGVDLGGMEGGSQDYSTY
ncbi:hypothetical protein Acr_14g0002790 [Actinidia rufa]|uniref:Zinc finger PHD-type domain-containing protein n=1 Tax=Actinidia rufa TaxID=165716 RepID=A0A7J0FQ07_9ERIC|nr:hypothetical protein Acr_14g0002790 [Actinidia rufa]